MSRERKPRLQPGTAPPGQCFGCWLELAACICPLAPGVATRTRFVLLRHDTESRKRTNTGRLIPLALTNAEIVSTGGPGDPHEKFIPGPGVCWLLHPDGSPAPPGPPPDRVYVIDGTWSQARRIFLRNPALHRLPRFAVSPPAGPRTRLRRSPAAGRLATLEAVALAVDALESPGAGRAVMEFYDEFVRRNVAGARRAGRRLGV